MLTLRKAKTAMCKLDIYNERFRYLSCAFQISVFFVLLETGINKKYSSFR